MTMTAMYPPKFEGLKDDEVLGPQSREEMFKHLEETVHWLCLDLSPFKRRTVNNELERRIKQEISLQKAAFKQAISLQKAEFKGKGKGKGKGKFRATAPDPAGHMRDYVGKVGALSNQAELGKEVIEQVWYMFAAVSPRNQERILNGLKRVAKKAIKEAKAVKSAKKTKVVKAKTVKPAPPKRSFAIAKAAPAAAAAAEEKAVADKCSKCGVESSLSFNEHPGVLQTGESSFCNKCCCMECESRFSGDECGCAEARAAVAKESADKCSKCNVGLDVPFYLHPSADEPVPCSLCCCDVCDNRIAKGDGKCTNCKDYLCWACKVEWTVEYKDHESVRSDMPCEMCCCTRCKDRNMSDGVCRNCDFCQECGEQYPDHQMEYRRERGLCGACSEEERGDEEEEFDDEEDEDEEAMEETQEYVASGSSVSENSDALDDSDDSDKVPIAAIAASAAGKRRRLVLAEPESSDDEDDEEDEEELVVKRRSPPAKKQRVMEESEDEDDDCCVIVEAEVPAPAPKCAQVKQRKGRYGIVEIKCKCCGYWRPPHVVHKDMCGLCAEEEFNSCEYCGCDRDDPEECINEKLCDDCCKVAFPGESCKCGGAWDGDLSYEYDEEGEITGLCEDCSCGSCGGKKIHCNGC